MLKAFLCGSFLWVALLTQAQAPFTTTVLSQDHVNFLRGVHFITEDLGYAVDYQYKVIKTIDGGATWTVTELPDEGARTSAIYFTDELTGYVVGYLNSNGERIYKTTDGGMTWTTQVAGEGFDELKHMDFLGDLGIAVGQGGIHRTTDGITWTKFDPDPFVNASAVKIVDEQTIYVGGLFGRLYKSEDAGLSWTYQELTAGTGHIYAMDFWNSELGLAVGQTEIRKTTNGTDWTIATPDIDELYGATIVNDELVIATGRGQWSGGDFGSTYGKMAYSTDQGETWEVEYFEEIFGLVHDIHFPTPYVGYAVSGNQIIKFELEQPNTTVDRPPGSLSIFPNPAENRIQYEWPAGLKGAIDVSISNNQGMEVLGIEASKDTEVNIADLAPGVYYLELRQGSLRWLEKFVKQ